MTWFPRDFAALYQEATYYDEWDTVPEKLQGRIAIVGLPDAGKKTLVNSLWGWQAVGESGERARSFGLINLVDLPGDPYDAASVMYRLESAALIIYVLDGRTGLDQENFNWVARMRSLDATILVVLNRADAFTEGELPGVLEQLEERLARPVVALSSDKQNDIQNKLVPIILKMCPELAVPLAMEMPVLRRKVAHHVVARYAIQNVTTDLDNTPVDDTHAFVRMQARMVGEIATIYGFKRSRQDRTVITMILRQLLHYVIPLSARIKFLDTRVTASVSILVIGHIAILGYGASLPGWMSRFSPQAWRMQHVPDDTPEK